MENKAMAETTEVREDFKSNLFVEKLQSLKGQKNIIVITQVDPDAIACAFGMRHIMEQITEDDKTRICYSGSVSHLQNRCIVNRYDLMNEMEHIDTIENFEENNIILVDSSKVNDIRFPHPLDAQIVIDHHRSSGQFQEGAFVYIKDIGACATLLCEMAQAIDVTFTQKIKTLLALGIYTDTKGLLGASSRDTKAYSDLIEQINVAELGPFINYPLPHSHFANLQKALSQVKQQKDKLVTSCGIMQESDGDDLSTIADYLLRMSGAAMVVVWGLINGRVRISARNQDLTTPLDNFLKKRFGPSSGAKFTPDGKGEGGATIDEGLEYWLDESTEQIVLEMIRVKIESQIFTPREKEN
ncbi:MAG: DHH family phosphoesterase [Bacteroidota bacterium]